MFSVSYDKLHLDWINCFVLRVAAAAPNIQQIDYFCLVSCAVL